MVILYTANHRNYYVCLHIIVFVTSCVDERNGKTVTQGPDIAVQIECDSENNTVINFRAGDYAENYDLTFAFICTLMNGTELQQVILEPIVVK